MDLKGAVDVLRKGEEQPCDWTSSPEGFSAIDSETNQVFLGVSSGSSS